MVLAPTSAPELLTSLAAVRLASRGALEPVAPREGDLDVALQGILGLCAAGPVPDEALPRALRRAAPFAALDDAALEELLEYLLTGGEALSGYPEARRVALDERGWSLSDARSRQAYLRGVGTIVDEPAVQVRAQGRPVGALDGRFAAVLEVDDCFALAGSCWRVLSKTPSALEAAREPRPRGRVARWSGSRAAQSELVAEECERLLGLLDGLVADEGGEDDVARALEISKENAAALADLVRAQRGASAVPTPSRFVVELVPAGRARLHIVAHTFAGSMANEVLARVLAARARRAYGGREGGADVWVNEASLAVTVARPAALPDEAALRELLAPGGLEDELLATLEDSDLVRAHFRDVARVAQLVVGPDRPGAASPRLLYDVLRKHAPGHVLLRALGQTVWSALDGDRAERTLASAASRRWRVSLVRGGGPSALAVPLFAAGERDRLAPEDLEGALAAAAHALYTRRGAHEELP